MHRCNGCTDYCREKEQVDSTHMLALHNEGRRCKVQAIALAQMCCFHIVWSANMKQIRILPSEVPNVSQNGILQSSDTWILRMCRFEQLRPQTASTYIKLLKIALVDNQRSAQTCSCIIEFHERLAHKLVLSVTRQTAEKVCSQICCAKVA
jgi:hypothetical protein